jgi:hypothetical protein
MTTELAQLVRARVACCNEGDWAAVQVAGVRPAAPVWQ